MGNVMSTFFLCHRKQEDNLLRSYNPEQSSIRWTHGGINRQSDTRRTTIIDRPEQSVLRRAHGETNSLDYCDHSVLRNAQSDTGRTTIIDRPEQPVKKYLESELCQFCHLVRTRLLIQDPDIFEEELSL